MEEDENILIPQLDPSNTINDSDQFIKQEGARTFRADASVVRDYIVNAVTAALISQRLQTVDGAGSGIDSDLLDGQHGAFYRDLVNSTGTLPLARLNVNEIFNAILGIDGANSGLDADRLDGQHGSFYTDIPARLGYTPVSKSGDVFTNRLSFASSDSSNIASRPSSPTPLEVRGNGTGAAVMTFNLPNQYAAFLGLDTDSRLKFGGWSAGAVAHEIWHQGNDGNGSGLDADLLDGQHGSYYRNATNLNAGTVPSARLNHIDIFNQILTRDGAGSALDADLLDGLQGSDYRNASNLNAGTVPLGRLNIPEIFASIRNIDGAGSTLDADLLDGNHGSYYRNASNLNAGTVPLDRLPVAGTGSPGIVELAIFTEALTNGIANRAITPDSLYDATRGTNNTSGDSYWSLPGGWFIQTGRITTGIQSLANGQTLNFPTAFPTQCIAFFPVWFGNHSSDDNTVSGLAISRSQYQLYFSAGTREPGVQWVAIGR